MSGELYYMDRFLRVCFSDGDSFEKEIWEEKRGRIISKYSGFLLIVK